MFDAVLHHLPVVGEAVGALDVETKQHFEGVPWPSIIGLRNVVFHEYFRVDPGEVQQVIDEQVAPLLEECKGGTGERV